jgi:hypothetical protein
MGIKHYYSFIYSSTLKMSVTVLYLIWTVDIDLLDLKLVHLIKKINILFSDCL